MAEAPNATGRFRSLQDPQVWARIKAAEEEVQRKTAGGHEAMSADEWDWVIDALRARRAVDDQEPA